MNTKMKLTASALVLGTAAFASATACSTTTSTAPPKPAPTVTQTVPGPTETQTEAPPAPPPSTKVATFKGSGNSTTPQFTVPDSGDYVVSWSYSGNVDNSFGSNTADNFNIETTGANGFTGSLPNDIATSGHGSTEITGDSGTESFNVMANAACTWTITVVSAP